MTNNDINNELKKDVDTIIFHSYSTTENEKRFLEHFAVPQNITDAQSIINIFKDKKLGNNALSIVFSHDNYLDNNGGIQKCIQIEEKIARKKGEDYLHIYPVMPRVWIATNNPIGTIPIALILNGELIAQTNATELAHALKTVTIKKLSSIIHSLLGHNLDDIINIITAAHKKPKWFFWLHDYTSICSNFNLLRNNVTYCDAPSASSLQCKFCNSGKERASFTLFMKDFFEKTNPIVISPSEFTKNLWLNKTNYKYSKIKVVNHYNFGKAYSKPSAKNNTNTQQDNEIKLAYVGTVGYHKGWNDFIDLARNLKLANLPFSFYVFAKQAPPSDLYKHINVEINSQKTMQEQLIENEIDVAFIGSIWPETFCLTAYEALAADAFLVVNHLAGNVVDLIKKSKNGYIYHGTNDLINYLSDENTHNSLYKKRLNKKYHELIISDMTYS